MARPPLALADVAAQYECVRITDMAGVDLGRYVFDRDLTFCALLMHADGTLYHTFGGRTWEDPQSYLSVEAFVKVLTTTLDEHRAYDADPSPPVPIPEWTVERIAPLARRIAAGRRPECIHCHSVEDWEVAQAMERGTWQPEDAWVYPDPIEIGLTLDAIDQARIVEVVRGSPADRAGLRSGDRLIALNGRAVTTFGDVQRALHETRGSLTARTLPLTLRRSPDSAGGGRPGGGRTGRRPGPRPRRPVSVPIPLTEDWRTPDPLTFSWRSMKWNLEPAPGFGGPQLDAAALEALGLPPDTFAYRVQYLVTWGPRAYTGRNAAQAGIREGDVIVAIDGKRDFRSLDHVHAWFRLTRRAGQHVPVELLRGGQERVVMLPVIVGPP